MRTQRHVVRRPGRASERGSVLVLVPAAILVLVVLGAIAVDAAVVFLGQRELANAAAAAANDAVTVAVDQDAVRAGRGLVLRPDVAQQVADRALARTGGNVTLTGRPEVEIRGLTATVTMTGTVDHVLARAIPGVKRTTTVHATSTGRLVPSR